MRDRPSDALTNESIAHGICRFCSKRKFLYLPARMCERCLHVAARQADADMMAKVLQEFERMEEAE